MKTKFDVLNLGAYGFGVLMLLFVLVPWAWMISTSLKTPKGCYSIPPKWITPTMTTENYFTIFTIRGGNFVVLLCNSIIYATTTTALVLTLGALAGYGFARFNFRGNRFLLFAILFCYIVPQEGILIPLYRLMGRLHLINTRIGMIFVYTVLTLPLSIWILASFFETIPRELEEAAIIDGCSRLGAFFRVVLPVSTAGLAAAFIYAFAGVWNEYMYSLVFLQRRALQPLSVGMGFYIEETYTHWGQLMAAAVLGSIPLIALAIWLRKYFVRGMMRGAVKG